MGIRCKNCFKENFCGCPTCRRINKGKLFWTWYAEMFETCGGCGATLPQDEIMEKE